MVDMTPPDYSIMTSTKNVHEWAKFSYDNSRQIFCSESQVSSHNFLSYQEISGLCPVNMRLFLAACLLQIAWSNQMNGPLSECRDAKEPLSGFEVMTYE